MKTICIYHSRDLDGWMSAAIIKKWFLESEENNPNTLEFLGWDFGDEIPDLSSYDRVIMVDISFSKEDMEKIDLQSSNGLTWIDHHLSAIKSNNFISERDGKSRHVEGLRNTKYAACELTWKYFFPEEKIPEIVRLLGRYDCFGHKGTDEEQKVLEFQYGARAIIKNYSDAYIYLCIEYRVGGKYNQEINKSILDKGIAIYQYLCTESQQTYKKAFPVEFNIGGNPGIEKHKSFLCVNQERFNPINFGIDYHKEGYDGFACFWYKDGKWMWSLYNDNGEVDCSAIAKGYDGGGHKGAAGFVCDTKELLTIINK